MWISQIVMTALGTLLSLAGIWSSFKANVATNSEHGDGSSIYLSWVKKILDWLRRFPEVTLIAFGFKRPKVISASGIASVTMFGTATVRGIVTPPQDPADAPLTRRFEVLLSRVELIERQHDADNKREEEQIEILKNKMETQDAARVAGDERLESIARSAATSSIPLQVFGLMLVALGTGLLGFASLLSLISG